MVSIDHSLATASQLFQSDHLSSSVAQSSASFQDFGGNSSASAPPQGNAFQAPESQSLSTLDEPVWNTVSRDLKRISQNLVLVVFPFNSGRENQQAALRNWDLWGPMVCPSTLYSSLRRLKTSVSFKYVLGSSRLVLSEEHCLR